VQAIQPVSQTLHLLDYQLGIVARPINVHAGTLHFGGMGSLQSVNLGETVCKSALAISFRLFLMSFGCDFHLPDSYFNPDKGFSGCGFELIAGLQVELGLERVDLVGGDGRDDVDEGVDDGSMLGQIEG